MNLAWQIVLNIVFSLSRYTAMGVGIQAIRFILSINTNNGTERQNESLKYQYLKDRNHISLSGMVTTLSEKFLPGKYRKLAVISLKVYR